ncbi:MAG: hypothetical protein COZ75_08225 [Flavobacteriaceae bacterium CG_4_8_14_3_um_filter_34_10]|nr:toxin-antitoxin system YwqK family antitoxin [Flavobacteriia bacterium]OIP49360.1 MAG: hypothetical protein AUK33_10715 [Flavobacteriaceae bacterium CG2_30_34_30]PIQ19126.1 MAG: hypothetical protein COW66_02725 [Flavobacteriaceae bacterium CG18_big_fil_WC_8_21_14_2_50_34_36]PIV50068.1 MAG: hypothetical protein COS19_05285 [Flavobacteriaceae bacterium CG02_land_8_20_14_3_00_34_13]PIX09168.1 MAG: hypothetical protein COZ75_08225 [Flavobacteriaceae bacterium CG_4_8_14_3_um_filter_34_10]PIZ0806
MRLQFVVFLLFFSSSSIVFSQGKSNQLNENGNRHGHWKQYYPGTNQLRYEGTFQNGKEIGTFTFYCETCKKQPSVIKEFNAENNIARIQYFSMDGKLLTEGEMNDKNRIGMWCYYQNNSDVLLLTEEYADGVLHGEKITYYENGKVTEKANYAHGKLQGETIFYDNNGTLIKRLNYVNGELHGIAKFYTSTGLIMIEGNYKNNKEYGVWKYYSEGNLVQEVNIENK